MSFVTYTYTSLLQPLYLTFVLIIDRYMQSTKAKKLLSWSLIAIWLLGSFIALWWFQQSALRPFIDANTAPPFLQAPSTQATLQDVLPEPDGRVTLVHFWNPGCLCNQVSQRHFNGLVAAFSEDDLRVIVLAPPTITTEQKASFLEQNSTRFELVTLADDIGLPSSPGLALMNGEGAMSYFGAYGFGALCTISDEQFFPNMVRAMKKGPFGPFMNVAGQGCFCPWPTSSAATVANDE